jgi:elongation factor Ts
MQIAAMSQNGLSLRSRPVVLENEKSILLTQTMNEGKPQAIAEKIVAGRINKFYEEVCLLSKPLLKKTSLLSRSMCRTRLKSLAER